MVMHHKKYSVSIELDKLEIQAKNSNFGLRCYKYLISPKS